MTSAASDPAERGWLVSPLFDLFFLANLAWPLLLLPGLSTGGDTVIDFWQIYFLTLPHRWITLVLVLYDSDRRDGRDLRLAIIAGALGVLTLIGFTIGQGAFLCLAMIDYLWNSWHFASQHAGVQRIYSRKSGGGSEWLERWGLRFFITYTAIRAAGWTTGWLENEPELKTFLTFIDAAMLAIPLALIFTNLTGFTLLRLPKLAYLLSVCGLYSGFLISLQNGWARGIIAFAAAGSMFHAVEYLAIVTHYAWRRQTVGGKGPFRDLAKMWLLFLGFFVLLLGSVGAWLSSLGPMALTLWQGLNLWGAFVHYAFDGMIWKLRRPATAAALGASNP